MSTNVAKKPAGKAAKLSKNPEPAPPASDAESLVKMVRLRPVFQKRIKRVAEKYGMNIGEYIEHRLGDEVNREFGEIVEADLKELREEE